MKNLHTLITDRIRRKLQVISQIDKEILEPIYSLNDTKKRIELYSKRNVLNEVISSLREVKCDIEMKLSEK